MKAKQNSYKRVTNDQGNFTYPQIPENIIQKKGEKYWKNKTLCGTNEPKTNQYSLIRAYKKHIFPRMEEIARQESEGGKYKIVFIEQEDGAGCHTNVEYQDFKDFEFKEQNWLRRMQSPQSPLFNVNDIFYFKKLIKEISA